MSESMNCKKADHSSAEVAFVSGDDYFQGEKKVGTHIGAGPSGALALVQSLGLAGVYMFASTFYFIGIRYSKKHGEVYDGAFLVLAIELLKLIVSVVLKYLDNGEFLLHTVLCSENRKQVWQSGLPYMLPSFLYAVYNNLTFYNLDLFDPGTYQVFMQTRIIFTGILFTIFLNQPLTVRKWAGLVVLSLGVACKYFSFSIQLDWKILFMLLQALLSSLAGVYNEYVLKKNAKLSIHMQNFFMYFYAILFNIVIGMVVNPSYYMNMSPSTVMHPIFIPIVVCGCATGLSAAFILKFIDVIVKAFASAVEVLLTAVIAAWVLGDPLTSQDFLAAVMVMLAVTTYYTKGIGDSKVVTC